MREYIFMHQSGEYVIKDFEALCLFYDVLWIMLKILIALAVWE
jgi:hypothetical protein